MGEGLIKSFRKETEVVNATNLSEKRRTEDLCGFHRTNDPPPTGDPTTVEINTVHRRIFSFFIDNLYPPRQSGTINKKANENVGWKGSSVVKNACCSSKGSKISS